MFGHHDGYPVFLPLDEYVGRVEAPQVQHLMDGNLQHRVHILVAALRIRIRGIYMFLGLLDPVPDPSYHQAKIVSLDSNYFVTSFLTFYL
jgi:hypothetical protein